MANASGTPVQSYRRDQLSRSYRRDRAAQVAEAASVAQARRDHSRRTAAEIVATHGSRLVVEDVAITPWSRQWGAAVAAFSPGMLVREIDREARAVAAVANARGGIERAATGPTALSQQCPCGARVTKQLGNRIHVCLVCRLHGDRDAVAALLASFVVFGEHGQPASARVDYRATTDALPAIHAALSFSFSGWQSTLSESTDLSAREGSFLTWSTSTPDTASRDAVVARRIVGWAPYPTLDETGACRTTSGRARMRAQPISTYDLVSYLRDSL